MGMINISAWCLDGDMFIGIKFEGIQLVQVATASSTKEPLLTPLLC